MTKKILIGSLQYSPIYKSHCCALGNQCERCGYSAKYLLSHEYEWMLSEKVIKNTKFIGNSKDIHSAICDGLNYKYRLELKQFLSDFEPDYIYFHNYHPFLNNYIAKLANEMGIAFIQHVHEPYIENKTVYKGIKQYWLYLFEFLQGELIEKADIVVISSQRALNLFDKRYGNFQGKRILIPLMYEDLGNLHSPINRRYILFIGPPVPAKSPETFLNIVDYSMKNRIDNDFLLVTRKELKDERYLKDNLTIVYKDKISDSEMGYYQRQSLVTITPYKIATQSSVVLTSYMYGTPVLSSDIKGLNEVVHHLTTGYLLKGDSNVEEWINGISFIKENEINLSSNCRNYFLKNFSEINWPKYFSYLFG